MQYANVHTQIEKPLWKAIKAEARQTGTDKYVVLNARLKGEPWQQQKPRVRAIKSQLPKRQAKRKLTK